MARVFLSNETYNAATDNADILGAAGSEQVNVLAGTTGLNIASSVERVDLSGNIADYTFSSFGAAMTIRDSAGNIVGTVSDSGGKSVVFADGALSAVYAGTTLSLGGVALTGTAAAITPAAADIDATTTSDAAGAGTGGGTTTGVTRALTVDDDTFSGTSLNDTYTAAAGTLNSGDRIIDGSSSDNDSLVVTLNEAVAPTISSIENINVDIDVFDGTTAALDASNISGATITMFSDRTLFNGTAEVDGLGDNNVTAGSNVDTLTITGLEAGVINTGSADTVSVTTAADTDVATVTVNGDVDLTIATSKELALTATAASVVALTPGAVAEITITGDATVQGDADDLGLTITGGSLDINADGTLDAADITVSSIEVSVAAATTIENANGQTINLTEANADLTVTGDAAAVATKESVTINVSADQATSNGISVIDFDSSTINLSAAVDELAVLTIEGDATVGVSGDVTVTKLVATNAADTVTFTGSGNVDVTGDTKDVATVDSSGLNGDLTYTQGTDVNIEIVAGSGDDSITLAATNKVAAVSLGDGTNTLDASTVDAGTLTVIGGSGVDTVTLKAAPGASTIAMNGGAGNDIINFANGAIDITAATEWDVTGFTTFTVTDSKTSASVAATLAADGSQLSGVTSISIAAADNGENDDTLAVTVDADEVTTDLSALVVADTDAITFTINGDDAVDDVITGTNGDDTIDGGKGADVLTGGAGADTFQFAAGDSVETALTSITDFSLAEFDVLKNVSGAVAANLADEDVSEATTLGTDTISADVVNGIMTLSGADAANIDTLEEWLDAAQIVSTAGNDTFAFEFGGNTYVVEDNGAGIDVVELVGVTGLEAIDTAAGAFTLVIA